MGCGFGAYISGGHLGSGHLEGIMKKPFAGPWNTQKSELISLLTSKDCCGNPQHPSFIHTFLVLGVRHLSQTF
jgi:hypothetical protein